MAIPVVVSAPTLPECPGLSRSRRWQQPLISHHTFFWSMLRPYGSCGAAVLSIRGAWSGFIRLPTEASTTMPCRRSDQTVSHPMTGIYAASLGRHEVAKAQ